MARFPLEVAGELVLTGERGEEVEVRAADAVVSVDAPSVRALLGLLALAGGRAGRAGRVHRAQGVLAGTGLRVDVALRGTRIGSLDGATRAGPVARALGLGPVRLDLPALLRALLGR